jgi:very-short-patch-repair endonuclease
MGPFLDTDRRIAALAARQDGVVRHDQLRELGLTPKAIRSRRETRRLVDVHRTVYAVGHSKLSVDGRRLAAAWAYGPNAVLSHRTAAAVWNLRASGGGHLHVTVPSTSGLERREGTRLHRTSRPLEVDRVGLLPVTTVARTMLDLASELAPHAVEAALKEADVLGLFDLKALRAVVAAHPRRPGGRVLAGLLDAAARTELALTVSELEIRFRQLCDEHALPQPAVNARPLGFRVDFFWPQAGLVVETDGWQAHRTRAAFEEDRRRDQDLALAGLRTVRFTHRQIADGPREIAARLRSLLVD